MSPKEQAQHISEALQTTLKRIHTLEHDLYTTHGNREELKRLKRVRRALERDLDKLVKTIPAPVQYSLWEAKEVDAPRVAPSGLEQKAPSEYDHGDTLPQGVDRS